MGATPKAKSLLTSALLSHGLIIAQDCPVVKCYFKKLVPVGRLELPTHSLKGYCSSSWATRAFGGRGGCRPHYPRKERFYRPPSLPILCTLPYLWVYYITSLVICQEVFLIFSVGVGGIRTHNTTCSQVEVALLSLPHPRESGFCILRILDIFSACEVWFTFVFRTQEHRAVGSSVTRSYSLSWAPTFRGRLASLICVLIISQTFQFVKTFF